MVVRTVNNPKALSLCPAGRYPRVTVTDATCRACKVSSLQSVDVHGRAVVRCPTLSDRPARSRFTDDGQPRRTDGVFPSNYLRRETPRTGTVPLGRRFIIAEPVVREESNLKSDRGVYSQAQSIYTSTRFSHAQFEFLRIFRHTITRKNCSIRTHVSPSARRVYSVHPKSIYLVISRIT